MNPLRSVLVLALLMGPAPGCGHASGLSLPAEGTIERAPVDVEAVLVERAPLALSVRATGTSRPIRAADLGLLARGRIDAILVQEGQDVAEGATLVRLDGQTAQLSAAQARASAEAAEAQARQLQADVERLEPLAERGSISESRIQQLTSQRDAATAQAAAARAAASAAGSTVTNSTLVAPFSGTVVRIDREVGEVASDRMVRLVDFSAIEISVQVQGRDIGRLSPGDKVSVRFPATGQRVEGEVSQVGMEIDPSTRTAEVIAVVKNPDRALRSGMFAELEIMPSRTREAMVVPRTAVLGMGSSAAVFEVVEGTTRRRDVEVAPFGPDSVEILTGLEPGVEIVARHLSRVTEGTTVQVDGSAEGAQVTQ